MRSKLIVTALAAIFAISGGAVAYAPYLPRLLYEGYPAAVWPSPGAFAEIAGASALAPINRRADASARALPADLAAIFEASGGHALLVDRGGRLELEHYAGGFGEATRFNSFSMAKSLVGALVFKALAEGRLASLDVAIGDILPDYGDAAFRAVTLRDLLRMRGGVLFQRDDPLAADETKDIEGALYNPFGPMARLHAEGLGAIRTSLTADHAIADRFRYENVNTAIVAAALEKLYGRSVAALLSEKLWRPAGAAAAQWRRYNDRAAVSAYCCIFATARDWIRIGRYLIDNGTPSEPFLPEALWRELMGFDLDAAVLRQGVYGYHLRHDVLDRAGEPLQGGFSYMLGQGGQLLYLLPKHHLVVLRVGERMQLLHSTLYGAWNALSLPVSP